MWELLVWDILCPMAVQAGVIALVWLSIVMLARVNRALSSLGDASCGACGYSRLGLAGDVLCPECGTRGARWAWTRAPRGWLIALFMPAGLLIPLLWAIDGTGFGLAALCGSVGTLALVVLGAVQLSLARAGARMRWSVWAWSMLPSTAGLVWCVRPSMTILADALGILGVLGGSLAFGLAGVVLMVPGIGTGAAFNRFVRPRRPAIS